MFAVYIRPNHFFLQYCNWRKPSQSKHLTFQSVSTATWLNNCPAPIQCIHVYNALMVHTPGKLTNKAQRMLNILKVSLLLTMNVLITTRHSVILSLWCQRQTFHGQEYNDMRNLPVHTCMHSHPFWSKVVPTCQHYSGYQGLLLQHIIYNIHNM